LAAKLLSSGLIDGSVNGCGIELATDQVKVWQNRYDPAILTYSRPNDLPPKVVKAVIAVESHFWPAANWTQGEIGLGQMTGYGANLVLMWSLDYYQTIPGSLVWSSGDGG
jgi:hypothetical protein